MKTLNTILLEALSGDIYDHNKIYNDPDNVPQEVLRLNEIFHEEDSFINHDSYIKYVVNGNNIDVRYNLPTYVTKGHSYNSDNVIKGRVFSPVSKSNASVINLITQSKPCISLEFELYCDYPGYLFDKMNFSKQAYVCISVDDKNTSRQIRIDDNVFKNSTVEHLNRLGAVNIFTRVDRSLDLSRLTIPMKNLQISNFNDIIFNKNQSIESLYLRIDSDSSDFEINDLPKIKDLSLNINFDDDALVENVIRCFKKQPTQKLYRLHIRSPKKNTNVPEEMKSIFQELFPAKYYFYD